MQVLEWQNIYEHIKNKDIKALARAISLVENEAQNYLHFLENAHFNQPKIIGITGPPGAGKSSLTNALIRLLVNQNYRIAVLCVDPSSPFNLGALLGDRLRMEEWYLHPQVFIRSLASRGAMGGLSAKIIEITDVLKMADFDYIIIETVGVGQSEIDIIGLAETTVVVLVPESGDDIQTMKAGLMEIADIFVINKADRPDADLFEHHLQLKLAPSFNLKKTIPIIKTVATDNKGITELLENIQWHQSKKTDLHYWTLTHKALTLIQQQSILHINKKELFQTIKEASEKKTFHLYQFVKQYF